MPYHDADVSILSVCNCVGRLACGVVGDWALMRHGVPRPVVFGWFIWMMALAMVLLAIGTVPGKAGVSYQTLALVSTSANVHVYMLLPRTAGEAGNDTCRAVPALYAATIVGGLSYGALNGETRFSSVL